MEGKLVDCRVIMVVGKVVEVLDYQCRQHLSI
jgi:hypothetical protein